jgi:predicted DCC family thiol-disulfide oxidoreductase YuxK
MHDTAYPVVVYDGVCLLCSRWVRFLLQRDPQRQFRFASVQSESGRQLMLAHGLDPDTPLSLLLVENGRGYTDTDAIARVLRRLGLLPWTAVSFGIRAMPHVLRDPLYRVVARNRYRLFGRSEQCFVPSEQQRAQFMP